MICGITYCTRPAQWSGERVFSDSTIFPQNVVATVVLCHLHHRDFTAWSSRMRYERLRRGRHEAV